MDHRLSCLVVLLVFHFHVSFSLMKGKRHSRPSRMAQTTPVLSLLISKDSFDLYWLKLKTLAMQRVDRIRSATGKESTRETKPWSSWLSCDTPPRDCCFGMAAVGAVHLENRVFRFLGRACKPWSAIATLQPIEAAFEWSGGSRVRKRLGSSGAIQEQLSGPNLAYCP